MFTIIIQEKGGESRRMVFNKAEVTIGRVQGNDIVLPKGNVSKRHARIVLKDGKFIIVDLKSTNGTYVNGRKITSPLVVKDSDKIYIGDFIVGVDEATSEGDARSESTTTPPVVDPPRPAVIEARPPRPTEASPMNSAALGGLGMGSGAPEPAAGPPPGAPAPRPGPPRPAPGPALGPPPSREPREQGAGLMPSLSPLSAEARTRPPLRPGGTMPPPVGPSPAATTTPPSMAPGPAPLPAMTEASVPSSGPLSGPGAGPAFPPASAVREPAGSANLATAAPHLAALDRGDRPPLGSGPIGGVGSLGGSGLGMPGPQPGPPAMQPPSGAPSNGAGARHPGGDVLSLTEKRPRQVAPPMKRVFGRSVAMPRGRGVKLEPLDPKVVKMLDLQSNILERLRAKLDLDKIPMDRLHEEDLWQRASRATIDFVETFETSGELPKYIDQDTLIKETLNEALALGPLEDLLADDKIDEIIIDRRDRVVVGKEGELRGSGKAFSSDEVFERVVRRLVAEAGGTIDDAHPLVDLRMRDGTRLTAALSPIASRGACLVLKKAPAQMPLLADLVAKQALSTGMADFLGTCMTARRNILVVGAPGSGKTTLAASLAAAAPAGERVISIEEVAELAIARDEWIQLEARAGTGASPGVGLETLLETALRLGPDRLVVGDVRGVEALALVTALGSSIDGAIVVTTGDGAASALPRLVSLARLAAAQASDFALRELVAQAFEIVVHVTRWTDGSIRVASIEEVVGCTESTFDTVTLFQWQNAAFAPTGNVPRFYGELESRGISADQAIFR